MPPPYAALVVDFGGVLTESTTQATRDWCAAHGITYRQFVGPLIDDSAGESLIHRIETGTLAVPEFERQLGAAVTAASGVDVDATGFVRDVLGGTRLDETMLGLLDEARARGLRTALLSNSWGGDYPREVLSRHLDLLVISGEEGLRKPDPALYELTARRVGVAPAQCVFVDDLKANVAAADAVGMRGVLHVDPAATRAQVLALIGGPVGSAEPDSTTPR